MSWGVKKRKLNNGQAIRSQPVQCDVAHYLMQVNPIFTDFLNLSDLASWSCVRKVCWKSLENRRGRFVVPQNMSEREMSTRVSKCNASIVDFSSARNVTNLVLQSMRNNQHVTQIIAIARTTLTNAAMKYVTTMSRLTTLDLYCCTGLNHVVFIYLQHAMSLRDVRVSSNVGYCMFWHLPQRMHTLRANADVVLRASHRYRLPASIIHIDISMLDRKFEAQYIYNTKQVIEELPCFNNYQQVEPCVKSLDVRGWIVRADQWQIISSWLPNLKELQMDSWIDPIYLPSSLRRLDMSGSRNKIRTILPTSSVYREKQYNGKIRHLNLSGWILTDDILNHVCSHFPKLKSLQVDSDIDLKPLSIDIATIIIKRNL